MFTTRVELMRPSTAAGMNHEASAPSTPRRHLLGTESLFHCHGAVPFFSANCLSFLSFTGSSIPPIHILIINVAFRPKCHAHALMFTGREWSCNEERPIWKNFISHKQSVPWQIRKISYFVEPVNTDVVLDRNYFHSSNSS